MKTITFYILALLLISCNKESKVIPSNNSPTTPVTLTSVEAALIGTWILDKTEAYDLDGNKITVSYTNGITEYYNSGVLYGTTTIPPAYQHLTLLSTPNTTMAGYFNMNMDYNGIPVETFWKVDYNYAGTNKDRIQPLGYFIFTLTANSLILNNTVNPTLANTTVRYYHK